MMRSYRTELSAQGRDLTTSRYWNDQWCAGDESARALRPFVRPHPVPRQLARVMDTLLPKPTDILEVGCAPGTMLLQLAMLRPRDRFHGVDFSRPGLAQAKRLLASRNIQATLHFSDIREFEPEQKYGLVYSCGLIEHFTDPAAVLEHHVRLCAPGGVVFLSVPNYRGRIQQWFIQRLDPEALKTHNLDLMKTETLRCLLVAVGLEDVVAGSDGPATVWSRVAGRSLKTTFLRRIAQAWNLANRVGPRLAPWRSTIWAHGRVA